MHQRPQCRRGVQTLESILVIPFLAIVMAAMVQFGATMTVYQAVQSAADEGAREAAKAAATATTDQQVVDAAVEAVNEVLSVHSLTLSADSGVRVIVNDNTTELGTVGDASVTQIQTFPPPGQGELQVIVLMRFDPTTDTNPDPIPNLLKTFGVDVADKQFEVSSTAKEE